MEGTKEYSFTASDSALTSSILDHFESMQLNLQEDDKWNVKVGRREEGGGGRREEGG